MTTFFTAKGGVVTVDLLDCVMVDKRKDDTYILYPGAHELILTSEELMSMCQAANVYMHNYSTPEFIFIERKA